MEERHLSLSEVAGLMGVSERTVRRWIHSGKLRAYKPGRDYRIPESAVRGFVEESEISPKALRRSSPEPSLFNGLEDERRESKLPEGADMLLQFAHMLLLQWEAEVPGRAEAGDDEWLANVAVMWRAFGLANYAVLEEIAAAGLTDREGWLDRYMSRYMDVNASVHRLNAAIRAHSDSDMVPDELLLATLPKTA